MTPVLRRVACALYRTHFCYSLTECPDEQVSDQQLENTESIGFLDLAGAAILAVYEALGEIGLLDGGGGEWDSATAACRDDVRGKINEALK